jgi:hypothetical protein
MYLERIELKKILFLGQITILVALIGMLVFGINSAARNSNFYQQIND